MPNSCTRNTAPMDITFARIPYSGFCICPCLAIREMYTLVTLFKSKRRSQLLIRRTIKIGYNFKDRDITPFLEPTAAGPSTAWAVRTSRKLKCYTVVGYPEEAGSPALSDSLRRAEKAETARYNSCVLVSPDGEVVTNYRKTFLFETDEVRSPAMSPIGRY